MDSLAEKLLWSPSQAQIDSAQITAFQQLLSDKFECDLSSYEALYQWSLSSPELFWEEVWRYCNVISSHPYKEVLKDRHKMPGAQWFRGAKLNFAENLLRYRDEQTALIFRSEKGERQTLSYQELFEQVSKVAAFFRECGIKPNDRIAALMPNLPETVVAMLATVSIGAIWSSCSPDFGIEGILDRFSQIKPTLLVTTDGYSYAGKPIDCREKVETLLKAIPSIDQLLLTPFLDKKFSSETVKTDLPITLFNTLIDQKTYPPLAFEQLPFDHPLYIMYSSGTTGMPKCIVHGAGGTLIEHLKELVLHIDLRRRDKIFYFTTCGWMMWNWLVSSLSVGATLILYEGAPLYPTPDTLFKMAEEEEISVFGTSAKYISAVEKAEIKPASNYSLSSLRMICSTGSPLLPENFDFVYKHIKKDLCLASISGGTDILGCFALGNPTLPVYQGELQVRSLGMDVQIFDEKGTSIKEKPGELVCVAPFPSMPIYFWNDQGDKKYHDSYFSFFDNIWRHGDWAEITSRGGLIIYGRSDATLNPGGVRIGSAEIYRQVEKFPEVAEAIVVGQQWQGDERIILFLQMKEGKKLTEELIEKIKDQIRQECSPRHLPAKTIAVEDLPRTINGKLSEIAVKNVIHDHPIKNQHALANPKALELFKKLPELTTD